MPVPGSALATPGEDERLERAIFYLNFLLSLPKCLGLLFPQGREYVPERLDTERGEEEACSGRFPWFVC